MAASASSKPLQLALIQMIQRASMTTATHVDPAVERLAESQDGLEAELQRLDDEMASVTSVLEMVTLDPETSARMQETQECLKRTKKKLITIRGRLGRLRAYEESDRLRLTERSLDVFREDFVDGDDGDNGDGVERAEVVAEEDDSRAEAPGDDDAISLENTVRTVRNGVHGVQMTSERLSTENEEKELTRDGLT